jgi:Uma2 family endonuclease
MATVIRSEAIGNGRLRIPILLRNGDRMSQAEFHRRYEQYPESIKFELIKGTVYMASPEGLPHSRYTTMLAGVLTLYEAETPGVEAASHPTVILNDDSEPQPDLLLRIRPGYGGRSRTKGKYVAGPPELVIEIAHSSVALDLHDKKDDYQRNRVVEYVVVCVEDQQIHWFDLGRGTSNKVPSDHILRSKAFPGLWIATDALLGANLKQLFRVLDEGLASPEHARFIRRLEQAAKKSKTVKKSRSHKQKTPKGE